MKRMVAWMHAAAFGVACLMAAASGAGEPGLTEGDTAPEFTVKMVGSGPKTVTLSSLRGKYVLLVIITDGCGFCIEEIPKINGGYRQLASERFTVLAVVLGADRGDTEDLVKDNRILFPIGYDRKGELRQPYAIDRVPTSFLIDPRGTILSRLHATSTQFQEAQRLLDQMGDSPPVVEPPAGRQPGAEGEGPTPDALLAEAFRYYQGGELKKAYVRCRQALEADEANVRAHVLLGDIFRRADEPAKAVAAYEEALQYIDPEDYAKVSAAYSRITGTYVAGGNYTEAVRVYVRALQTVPEAKYKVRFYGEIGLCHVSLGNTKKARAAFEKFLALYKRVDPDTQRHHAQLYQSVVAQREKLKGSEGGSGSSH